MQTIIHVPRLHWLAAPFLLLIAAVATPHKAEAQNLVQNPDFANGLIGYTSTGQVMTGNYFGSPGALFLPSSSVTQTISTVPDTVYMVTFVGAYEPQTNDVTSVSFGTSTFPHNETQASGTPATYSFSTLVTGSTTNLTFNDSLGEEVITGIDIQAAPLPAPGSGILSFAVAFVGISVYRLNLKKKRC